MVLNTIRSLTCWDKTENKRIIYLVMKCEWRIFAVVNQMKGG